MPTASKRALIERFAALGFARIEATSYSNPKVVPQFADASELLKALPRREGAFYKATCANPKAVERALADLDAGFGVNEISLLVSATEAHTQKNLNRTRAEQWATARRWDARAGRFAWGAGVGGLRMPFEGKGIRAFAPRTWQVLSLGVSLSASATPRDSPRRSRCAGWWRACRAA